MEVRKERNRVLRDLAARKNLEFRRAMIGRTLSVVTLTDGALSGNFLKVELAAPREANQMLDVKIGSLSANGVREQNALMVLTGD
jgi:tRNA A37 methylthiotransferase MiaB